MIESESQWKNVVWVAGVARSGTSWVGQVFNSHQNVRFRFQPLFSYEFKGCVNEDSSSSDYVKFLDDLWCAQTEFLTQADKIRSGDYPQFEKSPTQSTLVFKENRYQSLIEPFLRKIPHATLVGVVRHPCAVINSWRKNASEFPPDAVLLDQWRFGSCKNSGPEDYFGYYKWKEVANLYLDLADQYGSRVCIVKFEELVDDRLEITRRMFRSAGMQLDPQTESFLIRSGEEQRESYYSVYKNPQITTQWKHELDPHIVSEIRHDLRGTRLEQFMEETE